jgi:hypothetical protein
MQDNNLTNILFALIDIDFIHSLLDFTYDNNSNNIYNNNFIYLIYICFDLK